jgi:hypothetical protein
MDRTPVTNSKFHRFVRATGHVTIAELAPKAADYPGAPPNMLRAGSLVFTTPTHAVDLHRWARTGDGPTARAVRFQDLLIIQLSMSPMATRLRMQNGQVRSCQPRPNGSLPRTAAWTALHVASHCPGGRISTYVGRGSRKLHLARQHSILAPLVDRPQSALPNVHSVLRVTRYS